MKLEKKNRGVARIFQREGGRSLCHTQMFGPGNRVCNYLALEKINGMLILRFRAFSPPLMRFVCCLLKKLSHNGGEGGWGDGHGHGPRTPPGYALDNQSEMMLFKK